MTRKSTVLRMVMLMAWNKMSFSILRRTSTMSFEPVRTGLTRILVSSMTDRPSQITYRLYFLEDLDHTTSPENVGSCFLALRLFIHSLLISELLLGIKLAFAHPLFLVAAPALTLHYYYGTCFTQWGVGGYEGVFMKGNPTGCS
jgi:hypothetical protein